MLVLGSRARHLGSMVGYFALNFITVEKDSLEMDRTESLNKIVANSNSLWL